MKKHLMAYALGVIFTANFLVSVQCDQFRQPSIPREDGKVKSAHGESLEDAFRTINRRKLLQCDDVNPYLQLTLDTAGPLSDVQTVTVNVSGVIVPSDTDWIAVVSPANSSIDDCPANEALYLETGDTSSLPLLCHYPVKFKMVNSDPNYMSCANSQCSQPGPFGTCLVTTCTGSVSFDLINIRTDISFVLFTDGLLVPCILKQTGPLSFSNPNSPLHGHISSVDSSGTSMRLTWVSGDSQPQTVQLANGGTISSTVTTFTPATMQAPANDFGWHDPGFVHSAVMTGLSPSTSYSYQYGSQNVGLSASATFTTPPAGGDDNVSIIMYGDMGKAERDGSSIHYIQPGSLSVIEAVANAVNNGGIDFVFHIGDISYATGFLVEWENFLDIINPVASKVSYMTAAGNHERDYPDSGSYYGGTDSGGECGIPFYNYFQMPTPAQDKPWYSIESGPVHFTIASTEHDWNTGTEQYNWIQSDFTSVNRTKTPWLIFAGHRPMYSSRASIVGLLNPAVDPAYTSAVEPLLFQAQVDLALAGHVHNYERMCAVYQGNCLQTPTKDSSGVDTFNSSTYAAPVQAIIGMGGFSLDTAFSPDPAAWSSVRLAEFGYAGIQATPGKLVFTFTFANGTTGDSFAIVKDH